jgi:hypothetical protein
VNVPVIKKWVSDEIARILGSDDDVVTDTIFNLIEGPKYVGARPPIFGLGPPTNLSNSPTSKSCRFR